MYKKLFILLLLAGLAVSAQAQTPDTAGVAKPADTLKVKKEPAKPRLAPSAVRDNFKNQPDTLHSPHKAVIRSLIIPGWGQLYNHKWWKVPIVYGGLGLIGSAIIFNQNYYSQFLTIAQYRRRGEQPSPGDKYYTEYQAFSTASDTFIENAVNSYRRNRDLAILGMLGGWGIQMIDAYIDAKFIHSYSMDDNLSFKVRPGLIGQPMYAGNFNTAFVPAIKVTFAF
ncbi:hypothetical protein IM792_19195 [Mucilaginibacter sp. JRF]|uniref:DUF5683 domain-containing protein n=1 Tax=Mucilaginibacter sp. JRF TaxID=2780088 RepID=UPI0018814B77|nr:DUF5683 domain-containing protein [Mucilaginibacter sp. JRF]MBE9586583.1 hypothetical protein [Mucilaginibacter sp. JRF]